MNEWLPLVVVVALGSLVSIVSWMRLAGRKDTLIHGSGKFGETRGRDATAERLWRLELVKQLNRAFGLWCIGTGLSLVFASILIGRLVFARQLDIQAVGSAIGVAANIALSAGAKQMHGELLKALENAIAPAGK